jgi:hypothetical protein
MLQNGPTVVFVEKLFNILIVEFLYNSLKAPFLREGHMLMK